MCSRASIRSRVLDDESQLEAVGDTDRSVFRARNEGAHPGERKLHMSMFGGEDDAFFDEAGSLTGEGAVVLAQSPLRSAVADGPSPSWLMASR